MPCHTICFCIKPFLFGRSEERFAVPALPPNPETEALLSLDAQKHTEAVIRSNALDGPDLWRRLAFHCDN